MYAVKRVVAVNGGARKQKHAFHKIIATSWRQIVMETRSFVSLNLRLMLTHAISQI